MNLTLNGRIYLRASLAHGAFASGATVLPFRREPVVQRNADGSLMADPYAVVVDDPVQRETLRQYAQRLLRIVWVSKSNLSSWTYAQMLERVAIAARMQNSLPAFYADLLARMGGTLPYSGDGNAEFVDALLSAGDNNTILSLLREPGERLLIITRMQAQAAAKYEGRELPAHGALFAEGETAVAPLSPRSAPYIPLVPVYSANALRNGVIRRGAARFILDRYGWRVPFDTFRSMFTGGSLVRTGEKGVNLTDRKAMLDLMPLFGLLGGPFNRSDMVEGSVKVSKCWPIVREAKPVLPARLRDTAGLMTMADIVDVEAHSRRDDAKMLAADYLSQKVVVSGEGDDAVAGSSMVFEREVLIPGTQLHSEWHFYQTTPHQVGAWLSGWVAWAERPFLGGVSQQGHGAADVRYTDSDGNLFLAVEDGEVVMGAQAQKLFDDYCAHLDASKEALKEFLSATDRVDGVVEAGSLQADIEATETD